MASIYSVAQYLLFIIIVTVLVKPLGGYVERVFSGKRTALDRFLLPLEKFIYRITRVDPAAEMTFPHYATCFVLFGLFSTLLLYAILRAQRFLPWFWPAYQITPLTPDLAFNTAVSFSTTTTWQAYAGENTMSYFSQMAGLCAQNFLAGAAGLAVGMAFIRGLARQVCDTLGNFWVDLVRALLWVLVPGSLVGALLLVGQGVPMNFHHYAVVTTVEGAKQVIPQGPVAALEIIKNLGTNGGGFFNANGAHPYENPTPLSNFLEMLAIVLLPAALTNTFGRMVGQPRQGRLFYYVMLFLFICGLLFVHGFEQRGSPHAGNVDFRSSQAQSGGNMEGKEVRFGIAGTALAAVVTSNTATGSYNAMHDSFSSLGGMVLLLNMLLGELVFGGLGSGLYSMVMAAAIAVFLGGLMVGRTPEYLGKKIGPAENKMIVLYALAAPLVILPLTAIAVSTSAGLSGLTTNSGPHGFTEILFAYTSSFANNGQSFAGLSANTPFYNLTTALAMIVGRFGLAIPALALAALFGRQRNTPASSGTLPTHHFVFGLLLTACLTTIAALSYLPGLALGPILERLQLGN
ncbi:Potassium-transporting ATPase A chain [Candidatus Sulfotelmatobacter kueseliae]|uniref:Potassium-transporting ATPase potassium-binding subunit n=1 Tax=Candidatus Sulfotelmatobacter kueseliae TaxID=2042962 RepID=A0A2U3KA70_9BACT|nr:Potassium-transporting ATPase A chain [Candidatus Sulfotelmatobacter kueseliae]